MNVSPANVTRFDLKLRTLTPRVHAITVRAGATLATNLEPHGHPLENLTLLTMAIVLLMVGGVLPKSASQFSQLG